MPKEPAKFQDWKELTNDQQWKHALEFLLFLKQMDLSLKEGLKTLTEIIEESEK